MILFVRHGESAFNADGRIVGRADPPLTARGEQQAERLARALVAEQPVAVVSSPLARAIRTATAIADACSLPVEVDDRLTELEYGEWDGRALAELHDGFESWRADADFAPPGGETLAAARTRVVACAEELFCRPGAVVAVSHVTPIKAAVVWALGATDALVWRMHLGLASVTRIGAHEGTPYLVSFNETGHLADS